MRQARHEQADKLITKRASHRTATNMSEVLTDVALGDQESLLQTSEDISIKVAGSVEALSEILQPLLDELKTFSESIASYLGKTSDYSSKDLEALQVMFDNLDKRMMELIDEARQRTIQEVLNLTPEQRKAFLQDAKNQIGQITLLHKKYHSKFASLRAGAREAWGSFVGFFKCLLPSVTINTKDSNKND